MGSIPMCGSSHEALSRTEQWEFLSLVIMGSADNSYFLNRNVGSIPTDSDEKSKNW